MFKKIAVVLIAGVVICVTDNFVFAQSESSAVTLKAENAGNKICPISGEEINEESKATYEYKGKIYNFCCAGCIETFKENPEQYIK